jgi:tetratricopeptide (TPR) repeat protein
MKLFHVLFIILSYLPPCLVSSHTPAQPWAKRLAFPIFCSQHYNDHKNFMRHMWIESSDAQSINEVKDYLNLIPRNYTSQCRSCITCGGVFLSLISRLYYATNGPYGYDPYEVDYDESHALEEIHQVHSSGYLNSCECGDNDCLELSWDGNYFRKWNHKYFSYFRLYLHYCAQNPECDCYWIESSESALSISNTAYALFTNLAKQRLITPAFSEYWVAKAAGYTLKDGSRNYGEEYYPNAHGMASSLSTYTFFYSQYHQVLMDVASFIDCAFVSGDNNALDAIYETLGKIREEFLPLYNLCLIWHRHPKIYYERGLLKMHAGDSEGLLRDMQSLMSFVKHDEFKDILTSEMCQQEGEAYADLGMYDKAIASLNHAIQKDPNNKEAYFHRAAAYFETGNFDQALSDYLTSEKSKSLSKTLKVSSDFANALISGLMKGAQEAAVDFFPSLLNSAYGLSESLWVFGQHPIEQTTHFTNACYAATECAVKFCEKLDWAQVEEYAEDFKQFCERYYQLGDAEKGALIGQLIGKYGVDILAPGVTLKGVTAYKKLRNANRMCNLEAMAISTANKEVVQSAALIRSETRKSCFKRVKLHKDRQNKHIPGTNNYEPDKFRSILMHSDPDRLLTEFAGKGVKKNNIQPGIPGYVEKVDFGEFIGYYIDIKNPTSKIATTKGTIKYSKDGAHIVPSHPKG